MGESVRSLESAYDGRPIRPVSTSAPWQKAIDLRDYIAGQIRDTLASECVAALVYESQIGNYPPWVKLEAWLPQGDDESLRRRTELEFIVDVRPYRQSEFIWTLRLVQGNKRIAVAERPSLGHSDVADWTRFAIGRGPKPAAYSGLSQAIKNLLGAVVPPLHPRHNPFAKKFRTGFWRPSRVLIAGFLLTYALGPIAQANPAFSFALGLTVLVLIIGGVWTSIHARKRQKVVAVTPEPLTRPRSLSLVDSWHTAIAGLGADFERVRERVVKRVADARSLGADCRLELHSYRTPTGYEERERLVVAKDQGQVHVHVYPFGRDLYVGWHAFLNWAGWMETRPTTSKVAFNRETDYIELRPGYYAPQQFDLMDLNSLSEFTHSRIENELRAILREKAIDQEVDFEIVRGDRNNALDRNLHRDDAPAVSAGLWSRIFKWSTAWQPTALTELTKSATETVGRTPDTTRGTSGLALPIIVLLIYMAIYSTGLWTAGRIELSSRMYYWPVPPATFAVVSGLALWRFAASSLQAALNSAAVLFCLASGISIAQSAAIQSILPNVAASDRTTLLLLIPVLTGMLNSAALMLVVGATAPSLHKRSYWLVALIIWPAIGIVASSAVPLIMANFDLTDRSLYPVAYFAAALLKQMIVFACLGYWFGRLRKPVT
jgi:hypothetical protein